MKSILTTALLLLLCINASLAQGLNIQYSAPFEEPETGWSKVFQLSNGNTFFFHFTKKEGIEIVVYDKSHKEISRKTVTSELWDPRRMRESKVEGLYEIGGQPVLFLHQLLDKTPTLFRIKFNAMTGEMDGEKQIATLPRYRAGAGWAMMVGAVDPADFFVEKDPNSDCYAVINFNSFASESDQRIEVIHYGIEDGKHKVLNKAYYDAQGFKYTRFIGMTVDGPNRVYLCTYVFNTKNSGGSDSKVIVSRLDKGSTAFMNKMIDFTDDFKDTKAVMAYNPGSKTIQLLTLTYMNSKSRFFSNTRSNYYMVLMSYINPETLDIVDIKPMVNEKANQYVRANFNAEGYGGLPQDMIINKDNSTTVVYEEMTKEVVTNNGAVVSAKTYLGSIGVTELDMKGAESDGYAFSKMQMANNLIDPLYLSHKSKGFWSYRGAAGGFGGLDNNSFMSFDYINTDKYHYILFNDYPENFAKDDNAKRKKTVVTISGANTVFFRWANGKREKFYLFGTPATDDESKFCAVESSNFDKATNTYATMMIEKHGRDKQAKIAWIKFD